MERPSDGADPLLYLTRCQDFLALHPLADADILATFRTVLYGTARNWWEVARSSVTTWNDFETAFLSAFLSEDYEDELAERVRTRTQGEKESIRDFAFTYRALCRRWKPTLTENELVKMILKNIKPYLASQLRSCVNTVDELVKLGFQLEKDHAQQLHYDRRITTPPPPSQRLASNRPAEKPPVQCWRCKGQHLPGNCPLYSSLQSTQSSSQHPPAGNKHFFQPQKQGVPPSNNALSITRPSKSSNKSASKFVSIPQQLIVPINIGAWRGKAILDTGASYTLLHESLWKEIDPLANLHPWTLGPLYLANGEAEVPLGWTNVQITLHDKVFPTQAAILTSKALAYAVVLGLDFIFSSGLQINVSDQKYAFKSNLSDEYPFQPGHASVPTGRPQHLKKNPQTQRSNQTLSLLSSIPPLQLPPTVSQPLTCMDDQTLIEKAVTEAHLSLEGKQQLLHLLQSNPNVCTLQLGRTTVLNNCCIYTTHPVPIKQRPYRLTPEKQDVVREQLKEMMENGIVEPSYSAWASPVVLVPKKDGSLRFCVNYRKVNAITERDAYPLPNITESLVSLSGTVIFSTIDLNSGYWQVTMDTESKYQFNVMPFGLKNVSKADGNCPWRIERKNMLCIY